MEYYPNFPADNRKAQDTKVEKAIQFWNRKIIKNK